MVAWGGDEKGNPAKAGTQSLGFQKRVFKGIAGPPKVSQKVVRFFFKEITKIRKMITQMKKKGMNMRRAQVVFEYLIIFAITIVAIATIGFLPRIKSSFSSHYDRCVDVILERG